MSPYVSDLEQQLREAHSREAIASRRRASRAWRGGSVAAIAAVAIVFVPGLLPDDPTGATQSARRVLDQAAVASATQRTGGAVRYAKLRSASLVTTGGFNGAYNELIPETRELWIRPNGSGRSLSISQQSVFPTARDEAIWRASGHPRTKARTERTERSANELRATAWGPTKNFPTQVDALLDEVRAVGARKSGRPRDVAAFEVATDLLMAPDASPQLRSALFRVLGRLDGVDSLGRQSIAGGEPGQAVGQITSSGGVRERIRVVFDPATAEVIGRATEWLEIPEAFHGKAPYLVGYVTVVKRATVGRVGQRP